jgi:hypothetical protein
MRLEELIKGEIYLDKLSQNKILITDTRIMRLGKEDRLIVVGKYYNPISGLFVSNVEILNDQLEQI